MAHAFIHNETGAVCIVLDPEGYRAPDWSALPDPPAGPYDWNGSDWIANLAPLKAQLVTEVNDRAEVIRARYLTQGSGQAMTYLRKEDEARRFDPSNDPGEYPFISAEAASTGASLADTAALVLAQANAWATLGAAIEGHRRGLVVAIDAAADMTELNAIDTVSGWPGGE